MTTTAQSLEAAIDHHRAGRLDQAAAIYRQLLERQPEHARAWHLLGLIDYQLGDNRAAVAHLERATVLAPADAVFHADLAEVQRALGNVPAAVAACQRAIALSPTMADAHTCLGHLMHAGGKQPEAIAAFREALKLTPHDASTHHDLGEALRADGQLEEAHAELQTAVRLDPRPCQYHFNLGRCLYDQGKRHEAILSYEEVLRLEPGRPDALYNCGMARLALGDLERGWREFDARLQRQQSPLPLWNGEPLAAGELVVQAEHGLGDTLQFIRCVPLIHERVGEVTVEVQGRLMPLLADAGFTNLVAQGELPRKCARRIGLMSLPRMLATTLTTVPARVPYLVAREALVDQWRQRLAECHDFKVGICWQGGLAFAEDHIRSIPLTAFAPLANVPGTQLFSLQKGHGREQIGALGDNRFEVIDLADSLDGFIDTAAVIKVLDLVVTCDTSVAHLAGALAAPVWVALPFAADWRWMDERCDTPWYPTMRLFRQRQRGDWNSVFAAMAADLTAQLAGCGRHTRQRDYNH